MERSASFSFWMLKIVVCWRKCLTRWLAAQKAARHSRIRHYGALTQVFDNLNENRFIIETLTSHMEAEPLPLNTFYTHLKKGWHHTEVLRYSFGEFTK